MFRIHVIWVPTVRDVAVWGRLSCITVLSGPPSWGSSHDQSVSRSCWGSGPALSPLPHSASCHRAVSCVAGRAFLYAFVHLAIMPPTSHTHLAQSRPWSALRCRTKRMGRAVLCLRVPTARRSPPSGAPRWQSGWGRPRLWLTSPRACWPAFCLRVPHSESLGLLMATQTDPVVAFLHISPERLTLASGIRNWLLLVPRWARAHKLQPRAFRPVSPGNAGVTASGH